MSAGNVFFYAGLFCIVLCSALAGAHLFAGNLSLALGNSISVAINIASVIINREAAA